MTPTRKVLVVAGLLALAFSASAQDGEQPKTRNYRIFGQLTSLLELNQDEDRGDYTKFKQIAAVNIEWSKITIGARAEYLYYSDSEIIDPLDLDKIYEGLSLRQYYLDYQAKSFSGRLGTYFASFGRGLTLYVQKNDILGFDEPVHGAVARFNLKHFDITVLGGEVTEPILQNQFDRPFDDRVYGGRILARLPLDLTIGASAVRAELDRFFPEGTTDVIEVWSAEAGGTSLWGVLDLAAEFSEIKTTEPNRVKEGYGRYLSASVYAGPVSILAEYKDYYNFAYRYNLPPNAGRANEAYEHNDVKGPRLLVSADFWSIGSLFHASYGDFDTHSGSPLPDHQTEWYVGIEQTIGRVYFEGSYFHRDRTDIEIEEKHTLADFHVTIGKRGEIILGYDQRLEEASYWSLETTRSFLAYSLAAMGTISVRYSYEDRSGFDKDDFWGIEIQYLPTPNLILTVFGGGDPGGLVCAGGQCRQEPQFEGYRANFTWRF